MRRQIKSILTKLILFLIVIIISPTCLLFSQEVLIPLHSNPILQKNYNANHKTNRLRSNPPDTIHLPFLDDFSKENIYPDTAFWLDSNVYINRGYPIAPPTIGVATFDGVSKSGCPYDTTILNSSVSLSADTLTSKPINLSSFLPSDSIYLSFFWQAKGRGNDPESGDSLVLDFFNPTTRIWANKWFMKGYNPTQSDTLFHLVMVTISDTAYLKKAFQFRFRNKATISGNVDQWHIDYVFLDKDRNRRDTTFDDVAFAYNSPSLLKNYYAIPWEQYQSSEMKTNLNLYIRNNNSVTKNTAFNYTIYNNTGGIEAAYTGGNYNCDPFSTNGYMKYAPITNPPIANVATPYSYPALTDTATFTIKYAIHTAPDKDAWNDTIGFKQKFHNYYAYDDGTVEAGYGLKGYQGQMAYKFILNKPDTLFAVQMLFNWIPPKVSQRQFRIRIWNDAGGIPGTLIYEDSLVSPKYEYQLHKGWGNLTNIFHAYLLTTPQKLSGTFYVGLIQYCCSGNDELLNIGFDRNTSNNNNMFFDIGNGWSPSQLQGSWMIRPVFGDTNGIQSVKDKISTDKFQLYPNPTNGTFTISTSQTGIGNNYNLTIYNQMGEIILTQVVQNKTQTIYLGNTSNGIYFIKITNKNGTMYSHKLILVK